MFNSAKKWPADIRFWLLLFFLLRLTGITQPPLEVAHNWRQTTVCMVARNYSEVDANIMFPRIDIAGEKSGITGMEMPLLNYGMFLCSEMFGYAHWYGRLINLIFSVLGIWFFYLLVKFFFDHRKALFASLLLMSSLWFMYSRKAMPDTFSISLLLAACWMAVRYLYPSRHSVWNDGFYLLLFAALCFAGVGSKLPAGLVMVPLALVYADRTVLLKRKIILALIFLISMIPVGLWYFFWVPFLNATYGFQHFFMGNDVGIGWHELLQHPGALAKQFYDVPLKYSGFAAFLLGVILMFRLKSKRILWISALGVLFLIPYMISGGFTFIRHSYYILPFVPYMALIAAFGLDALPWKKLALVILFVICAENILNQVQDFRVKPKEAVLLNLEAALNKYSPSSSLIVINSGQVPTPMYFAHRKGWVFSNDELADPGLRNELKSKGCVMVVILKRSFGDDMSLPLRVAEQNRDWTLYFL